MCPTIKALLILFKYKPCRQVLHTIVKRQGLGQKNLRTILLQTVESIAKLKPNVLVPWKKNVGRHVSHHHGFLPTMQHLGILNKLKSKQPIKDIADIAITVQIAGVSHGVTVST